MSKGLQHCRKGEAMWCSLRYRPCPLHRRPREPTRTPGVLRSCGVPWEQSVEGEGTHSCAYCAFQSHLLHFEEQRLCTVISEPVLQEGQLQTSSLSVATSLPEIKGCSGGGSNSGGHEREEARRCQRVATECSALGNTAGKPQLLSGFNI